MKKLFVLAMKAPSQNENVGSVEFCRCEVVRDFSLCRFSQLRMRLHTSKFASSRVPWKLMTDDRVKGSLASGKEITMVHSFRPNPAPGWRIRYLVVHVLRLFIAASLVASFPWIGHPVFVLTVGEAPNPRRTRGAASDSMIWPTTLSLRPLIVLSKGAALKLGGTRRGDRRRGPLTLGLGWGEKSRAHQNNAALSARFQQPNCGTGVGPAAFLRGTCSRKRALHNTLVCAEKRNAAIV